MKREDLHVYIALGEDSTRQFKANVKNSEALASEMAAFANSEGGMIFIGVADDSSVPGSRGRMSSGSKRQGKRREQCRGKRRGKRRGKF
jgi:predicted HTH transcriptional regulator